MIIQQVLCPHLGKGDPDVNISCLSPSAGRCQWSETGVLPKTHIHPSFPLGIPQPQESVSPDLNPILQQPTALLWIWASQSHLGSAYWPQIIWMMERRQMLLTYVQGPYG